MTLITIFPFGGELNRTYSADGGRLVGGLGGDLDLTETRKLA